MNLYRFRDDEEHDIAEVLALSEEDATEALEKVARQPFHLIEEERDVNIAEFLPVIVLNNFRPF